MHADIFCHRDRRYKLPFTIDAIITRDDGSLFATMEIRERFATPRDASAIGIELGEAWGSYKLRWGDASVSDEPPCITTEID